MFAFTSAHSRGTLWLPGIIYGTNKKACLFEYPISFVILASAIGSSTIVELWLARDCHVTIKKRWITIDQRYFWYVKPFFIFDVCVAGPIIGAAETSEIFWSLLEATSGQHLSSSVIYQIADCADMMAENSLGSLLFGNQNSVNTQLEIASRRTAELELSHILPTGATTKANVLHSSNKQGKRRYNAAQKNTAAHTKIFPWMTESRNKVKSTGKAYSHMQNCFCCIEQRTTLLIVSLKYFYGVFVLDSCYVTVIQIMVAHWFCYIISEKLKQSYLRFLCYVLDNIYTSKSLSASFIALWHEEILSHSSRNLSLLFHNTLEDFSSRFFASLFVVCIDDDPKGANVSRPFCEQKWRCENPLFS